MKKADSFTDDPPLDFALLLTSQRTAEGLNSIVVHLLRELLGSQPFRIYINTGGKSEYKFKLLASAPANQSYQTELDVISSFGRNALQIQTDDQRIYFPAILDDHFYACLVTSAEGADKFEQVLIHLIAIYCNVYSLISASNIDGLTGLFNRRTFDRDLVHELQKNDQQRRHDDELGGHTILAMIDIDHFKYINDNYGHLIGDEVLLTLAQRMKHAFRDIDGCYRYGGEEFVVMLRHTDLKSAEVVLSRFLYSTSESNFPTVGSMTVSIGYCQLSDNFTPFQALDAADKALYYSKATGRNRISNYHQLLDGGQISNDDVDTDIELF